MKGGIGIIARLGSTRLFDKHLIPVNDVPIIQYLIERITARFGQELSRGEIEISLLTGEKTKNQRLADVFYNNGLNAYFGNDDNIPLRILQAMECYGWDYIISVDGDDILCSTKGMEQVLSSIKSGGNYISTIGLPFGMNSMGLRYSFLKKALNRVDSGKLETGWGWIFDKAKMKTINLTFDFPDYLRFTLDYKEDLEFFKAVINYNTDLKMISDKDLVDLVLKENMHRINKHLMDEYWKNFQIGQNLDKESTNG